MHLRDARRHVHAARGPGRPRPRELPELADARHHGARGHAGRRVPRPLRLGLRRRRPVRPDAALRHARTTSARFVDRAHAAGPRRHPRRRLQPPRPGRQLPASSSPPAYFTDRYTTDWGEAHQLRRRRTAARCASSSSPTPATGSTSSTSTACASTRRSTIFDDSPGPHPGRDRPARPRGGRRGAAIVARRPRTSRRDAPGPPARAGRLRPRRAVERRLPPHRAGRADRPQRGLLHRLPRHARRSSSPPPSTATSTRASTTPGRSKRRGTPGVRPAAGGVRQLPPEPRPGRQLRPRRAAATRSTSPGRYRAMTALLLLGPATPMLFQGQEFAASSPFLYFADHKPELRRAGPQGPGRVPRPVPAASRPPETADAGCPTRSDPATFERCKLDFARARAARAGLRAAPRPAAAAPRGPGVREPRPAAASTARCSGRRRSCCASSATTGGATGCCSSTSAATCTSTRLPEPLLAPPAGHALGRCCWSSEDPRYGGDGTPPLDAADGWHIPGEAAVVLAVRAAAAVVETAQSRESARRRSGSGCTSASMHWSDPDHGVDAAGPGGDRSPPSWPPASRSLDALTASGWSPTAWAATPPAPSPASPRAATTACSSPPCRRRSAAS